MTSVALEIEAVFLMGMSIGTVSVIKLLREHLGLGLEEAKEYVDRASFDGECVRIPAPSPEAAERLVAALVQLPSSPRVKVLACD